MFISVEVYTRRDTKLYVSMKLDLAGALGPNPTPCSFFTETDNNLPNDQCVFLNNTATFKFCSTLYPISYTINGMYSHEFPEHFQNNVTFDSNSSPCHFLSFPAWLEYDGAHIQFRYRNGTSRIATLHIQGWPTVILCVHVCTVAIPIPM